MLLCDFVQLYCIVSLFELFFDFVFVVVVSIVFVQLYYVFSYGDFLYGVIFYVMVFFVIWWVWMNFIWFVILFDMDDWLYCVMMIVQMGGVLVFVVGIFCVFEYGDF